MLILPQNLKVNGNLNKTTIIYADFSSYTYRSPKINASNKPVSSRSAKIPTLERCNHSSLSVFSPILK